VITRQQTWSSFNKQRNNSEPVFKNTDQKAKFKRLCNTRTYGNGRVPCLPKDKVIRLDIMIPPSSLHAVR
jgi:hypothetical protein